MTTVQTLLAHLVTAALMSDDADSAKWRAEAAQAHAALVADPAASEGLKIDGLWTLAVREAEAPDRQEAEGRVSFGLPAACPFTLGELSEPGFDIEAGVERIRNSASTG